MGNHLAALRCNGVDDEKLFGRIATEFAPSRGEVELLIALQTYYNSAPRRLVEVLSQVRAELLRNKEYEAIERAEPTRLKLARPYDRQPHVADAFRVSSRQFGSVQITVSRAWIDQAVQNRDIVMKIDLNYSNYLWDGDVVTAVDGFDVNSYQQADGGDDMHPIWSASTKNAFKITVVIRKEERSIIERINVLHRFSPTRTIDLLSFCIDRHKSLSFAQKYVLQSSSSLQSLQLSSHGSYTSLRDIEQQFLQMHQLRPRRTLFLLQHLSESLAQIMALSEEQKLQLHQIFKVNALEGFGLTVVELLTAFATVVSEGARECDAAIEQGTIPKSLKLTIAADKLWHVWWCCREIVRVGAIDYIQKIEKWRMSLLARVSERERSIVWMDPSLPVKALKPLSPLDALDDDVHDGQPLLAFRYGRVVLYSREAFESFLEKSSSCLDKPGGGPWFSISGHLWTGDAVVSICGVDVRNMDSDEFWHVLAHHRHASQPLTIGFDYFPDELHALHATAVNYVSDPAQTEHAIKRLQCQFGAVSQLPLPAPRHPINKQLQEYGEQPEVGVDDGLQAQTKMSHARQTADQHSAALYAGLGGHCGGRFSSPPQGASQQGAQRWLLRALVEVEENDQEEFRRPCKKLLGTQELWDESATAADKCAGLELLKKHATQRLRTLGELQEKMHYLPLLESAAEVGFLGAEFNELPLVPVQQLLGTNRYALLALAKTKSFSSSNNEPTNAAEATPTRRPNAFRPPPKQHIRQDIHAGLAVPNWNVEGKLLPVGAVNLEAMESPRNEMSYAVYLMLCASALHPVVATAVREAMHAARGRVHEGGTGGIHCKSFTSILDRTAKSYRRQPPPAPAANSDVCRLRVTFRTPDLLVAGFKELLRCPGVVTALRVENGYHFNCDALRRPHLHGLRSIKVKLLFQPTPAQLPHVHKKKPAERSEIPSGPGLTKKGSGSGKGAGVFSDAAELDPARDGDPASADPEPRSRPISPKGSKRELKRAGTSLAGDPAPNAAAGGETNQSPRGNHDTQHRTHHHHNHNRHHHHNHNHRSRHRMTEPKETEEDRKKKEQQERRDRKKNIRGFLSNTGCWSKRKPTKSQSKNNKQPPPGATTEMPGDDIATTVSESDDLDSHPTTGSGPLRSTRNLSWGQLFDHPATQGAWEKIRETQQRLLSSERMKDWEAYFERAQTFTKTKRMRDSNVSMVVEVELFLEPYQQLLRRTFFWRKLARAPNATWLTTQFREAAIQ